MHRLLSAKHQLLILVYIFLKQMSSHRDETSGSNDNTSNSYLRTPNRRSPVWEYYEPELVEEDGIVKLREGRQVQLASEITLQNIAQRSLVKLGTDRKSVV